MEHIVCSQICRHLDHNSTLHPNQYGCRKGFSCERQFVDTIHELAYSINPMTQTDVIFLEFSKVFDKVSRDKLLHKIRYYGIGGKTNTWISAFLCSRSQQVVTNGQTSQSAGVLSGQEVCWGLCCINIHQRHREGVISQMPMFTDDSILLTVKYTLPLTSHSSLTRTNFSFGQGHGTWILMWQSVLSYRLLPRRTYRPMITSWGANKYYGLTTRTYWGLTINTNLSWQPRINKVQNKASKTLGLLKRTLYAAPPQLATNVHVCYMYALGHLTQRQAVRQSSAYKDPLRGLKPVITAELHVLVICALI